MTFAKRLQAKLGEMAQRTIRGKAPRIVPS
jgi:hypothetical protein